jgi:ribose transport system permease protein
MTIVVLAGGIDLSVGSVFALSNLTMLALGGVGGLPLWLAGLVSVACGGAVGAVNGLLVGYLRLRAFLTTLVTMIVVRGLVDALLLGHSQAISSVEIQSATWDYIAFDTVLGMSVSFIVAIVLAVTTHLLLTRLRPGWHVLAVGGSRRAAFNAGIDVRRTVCATYILSGMFAALAGVFYAARLSSLGGDTGVGLEIAIITAVVLGGTTLGGGRGSVFKTVIGIIIVVVITNSLVRLGLRSGAVPLALGLLLLAAVALDVRWLKNRHKLVQQTYVAPVFFALPSLQSCAPGGTSPYAINAALSAAEPIGLGQIDAPEDVILDGNDDLYCGSRNGDVIRFFAPDYTRHEVFAHIGGSVLGLAFDRNDNLLVCVGGMGLYKDAPDRRVELVLVVAGVWMIVQSGV